MIKFAYSNHLLGLLAAALLLIVFIYYVINRNKRIKRLGKSFLIQKLTPNVSILRRNIKFFLFIIAFIFLIIAWANPQVGSK